MNYMHPDVQERFLALVGEMGDRYNQYPAWKGVALVLSRCMGPMEPALLRSSRLLQVGYEDFTIDLFEKETGASVPVDKKAPDRFERRYQWIMANAREQWIVWRCNKYTEFYKKLRDRIAAGRRDVKLYIVLGEPMLWIGSQEILDGHFDDRQYLLDIQRQFGFDLPRMKQEPGIAVAGTYALAGSSEARVHGRPPGMARTDPERGLAVAGGERQRGRRLPQDQHPPLRRLHVPRRQVDLLQLRHAAGLLLLHVRNRVVRERHGRAPTPPGCPTPGWTSANPSDGSTNSASSPGPTAACPTASTSDSRATASIRTSGSARTNAKGAAYAYAANLNWWRPTVTLRFAPAAQVRDLINDEPVTLDDGAWTFTMAPYSIQSFRLSSGEIVSARTTLPADDRDYVQSVIANTLDGAEKVIAEAKRREKEFVGQEGWEALAELEGRVASIRKRLKDGDLADPYQLTTGAMPIAQEKISRMLKGEKVTSGFQ